MISSFNSLAPQPTQFDVNPPASPTAAPLALPLSIVPPGNFTPLGPAADAAVIVGSVAGGIFWELAAFAIMASDGSHVAVTCVGIASIAVGAIIAPLSGAFTIVTFSLGAVLIGLASMSLTLGTYWIFAPIFPGLVAVVAALLPVKGHYLFARGALSALLGVTLFVVVFATLFALLG